jgi:hypothetical protein
MVIISLWVLVVWHCCSSKKEFSQFCGLYVKKSYSFYFHCNIKFLLLNIHKFGLTVGEIADVSLLSASSKK